MNDYKVQKSTIRKFKNYLLKVQKSTIREFKNQPLDSFVNMKLLKKPDIN